MKSMKHLNIMLNTTNNKIISFYLHTWMPGYNAAVNNFAKILPKQDLIPTHIAPMPKVN